MELRTKRASHPGYVQTGGPPRVQAAPGAKTKKELAKEAKEKKKKDKADGLKKIAAIERANTAAYPNDETPRSTQMSSRAGGRKQSKVRKPKGRQTVPSSESESEFTSKAPDTEDTEASGRRADEEQPYEPRVPSIEGSEPPTDLERTIKKKSKGKPNIRKFIEDLKNVDDSEEDSEEDSGPQETPVIVRTKRLRIEVVRVLPCL